MPRGSSYLPWGFIHITMEQPIIPFERIGGTPIPCPKSLIQLALSDYRNSDMTDRELAEYISQCLFSVLLNTNSIIEPIKEDRLLSFKEKMNYSKD